jgi:hypothetical protein
MRVNTAAESRLLDRQVRPNMLELAAKGDGSGGIIECASQQVTEGRKQILSLGVPVITDQRCGRVERAEDEPWLQLPA